MESEIKSVYPLPLPTILLMNWAIYFAEHLSENAAIVGLGMPDELHDRDEEERAADDFGLNLLTGSRRGRFADLPCPGACLSDET
jgi:hypothetical protein